MATGQGADHRSNGPGSGLPRQRARERVTTAMGQGADHRSNGPGSGLLWQRARERVTTATSGHEKSLFVGWRMLSVIVRLGWVGIRVEIYHAWRLS